MSMILWQRLVIALLLFFIINISAAFAQTTILSPSCIVDPSDPSRNILEITGNNYSSAIFNILSPISNCHIYIHDLNVTSVTIATSTIKNSNITIKNVVSGNKSIATFIWFKGSISNFSFIDISNVSHSSLSIDASTLNEGISIVMFDGAVTGKSDISSTISIFSLEMNNIICDRTSVPSTVCSSAMVYFASPITNFSSFDANTLNMNNVTMISSSSGVLSLSLVHFNAALLFVQKISIANVVVRNIDVRNNLGPCQTKLLNFVSTVTAGPQSIDSPPNDSPAEFIIRDLLVENCVSAGSQGSSEWRGFVVQSVSKYNTIQLRNVSASSVLLTSTSGSSALMLLYFYVSALASPPSSSSSSASLFIVDNIRFREIVSSTVSGAFAQLWLFYSEKSLANFSSIQLSNLTVTASIASSGTSGSTFLYVARVFAALTGPPPFSTTPTSLLVGDIRLENSSSLGGNLAQVIVFGVEGISNYDTIRFCNITVASVNAPAQSSSGTAQIFVFRIAGPVTARCCANLPSSSTSLVVENVHLRSTSCAGSSSSAVWYFYAANAPQGLNTIRFTNLTVISVKSVSTMGIAQIFILYFAAEITAPVSSSSSSSLLAVDNFRMQALSSCGKQNSFLLAFYVSSTISNYDTIRIENVSAVSLSVTSAEGQTSLYLAVVSPSSNGLSTSSLLVNNILLQNGSVEGQRFSQLWIFYVANSINNYNTIHFNNISSSNLFISSSSSASTAFSVYFTGLTGCSELRLDNIQTRNISFSAATSSSSSFVDVVVFASFGTYYNISKISLQNSGISQISISSTKQTVVRLMDAGAGLNAEKIIVNNNSLRLFSSDPTPFASPTGISAAIVAIECLSPDVFLKMELNNNILAVEDDHWRSICSPANCSQVRVADVQIGQGNEKPSPTLTMTNSAMFLSVSSFISFANYSRNSLNTPLLNFILEDNEITLNEKSDLDSILGFDASPLSSPLPSNVFVDVKCNHWPRIVDRVTERQLSSSASEVDNFIKWNCRTPTVSESFSKSSAPTSSTSPDSGTPTSSLNSSLSLMRTSKSIEATSSLAVGTETVSGDVSSTKSLDLTPSPPNISVSSSSSITGIKSLSFSPSQSASVIVRPPPYISPLRDVYETMAATSSFLSLTSMSSTNVLGAARSRSALSHFSDIAAGTCSLDFKSLSDLDDNPPDVSSSPTRLKLNGSYLTGQTVGNLIVMFGVGAIWVFGYVVIRGRNNKKHHKAKKNKRKRSKKSFMQVVIASNAHETVLFTLMLLLGPTLTSSAMSLIGEMKVEGRTITVLSVVCVVLSWFVLLVIGFGFTMWKLIYVRNFHHDEFEVNEEKEANDDDLKGSCGFRRFVEFAASPFGEWEFKGHRTKKKILFELASPFIGSFTDKCPKFIVIDVGVIVLLSLAEVIPRMVSGNSSSCLIRGVTVCVVLSLHVLLVIYYRPLYSDRMSNTVGCLVDILSVVIVLGAITVGENNVDRIEMWSRVAVAHASCQLMMSTLQVIEILLPVWDGGVKLVKKHCSSKNKKKKDLKSKKSIHNVKNLAEMMNQEEEHDSFTSPLLQEMAVISQTENVSHRKISHIKQKRKI